MLDIYGSLMPLRVLEEIRFWKQQEKEHTQVIRALVPNLEPDYVRLMREWEFIFTRMENTAQRWIETAVRTMPGSTPGLASQTDVLASASMTQSQLFVSQLLFMRANSAAVQANPTAQVTHIIRESEYYLGALQAYTYRRQARETDARIGSRGPGTAQAAGQFGSGAAGLGEAAPSSGEAPSSAGQLGGRVASLAEPAAPSGAGQPSGAGASLAEAAARFDGRAPNSAGQFAEAAAPSGAGQPGGAGASLAAARFDGRAVPRLAEADGCSADGAAGSDAADAAVAGADEHRAASPREAGTASPAGEAAQDWRGAEPAASAGSEPRPPIIPAAQAAPHAGLTGEGSWSQPPVPDQPPVPIGGHIVPPLPYAYNALEPYIDEETMRFHHDILHKRYVDDLNHAERMMLAARESGNFALIRHWEREAAFNGAGHYLHTLFWHVMAPKAGGRASGSVARQIDRDYGSFAAFRQHFSEAAAKVEGPGWAILVWCPRSHRTEILQAEKHQNLSQWDVIPLLVLDVWEHSYLLRYRTDRPKYIDAWWNTVNWHHVNERFTRARQLKWHPY